MEFIRSIENNIHKFFIPDRTNIKTRSISIVCNLSSIRPIIILMRNTLWIKKKKKHTIQSKKEIIIWYLKELIREISWLERLWIETFILEKSMICFSTRILILLLKKILENYEIDNLTKLLTGWKNNYLCLYIIMYL